MPDERGRPGRAALRRSPRSRTAPQRPARDTATRTVDPRRRQVVVLVAVLALLTVFAGRLVWVQGIQGPALAEEALSQRMLTVTIPGDRGEIVDTDGVVLATSVERYNIAVNQRLLGDTTDPVGAATEAAADLSGLLGIPATELGADLLGDRGFVYLAKGVSPEVYDQVMALGIPGISGERTTDRLYPAGTTAGTLLGFVGAEGHGMAGLEQVYDEVMAGQPGSRTYEQGRRGQRIPTGAEDVVPAVAGDDVQLTIDRDLQFMVQGALDAKVQSSGAEWGTVEVRDVRTGEILALADSASPDPNNPRSADASRAVAQVYEPGSTAKVITMAAILEKGLATPASQYVVPYTYAVPNGQSFKDSHHHPDLKLTLAGILAESSNTGTVMVGQDLPPQVRHDYLKKFGFGTLPGVGLPGESAGLLAAAEDWDGRSEYAVLFGQAVSVTTLQATSVFATLANDGVLVPPRIVAGTRSPDGTFTPAPVREEVPVVQPETAQTIVRMLEGAVVEGTGGNAAVPGYRIAGKTGTSQAFEGGGVVKNVASFIGIAPADDPRIVVNVALYDPKTSIYGGDTAAPVFREVTAHALRYLGVPPSGTPPELFPTTYE